MDKAEGQAVQLMATAALMLHVAVLKHLRRIGLLSPEQSTTIWNQALHACPLEMQDGAADVLKQLIEGLDRDILPPPAG